MKRVESGLIGELREKGLAYGAPVFVRIFKDPGVLEVWVKRARDSSRSLNRIKYATFPGILDPS